MSLLLKPYFKYERALENKNYVLAQKILAETNTSDLKMYSKNYTIEKHLEQFFDKEHIGKNKMIKRYIDRELEFRETHNVSSSNAENPFVTEVKSKILPLLLVGGFILFATKKIKF